MEFKRGIDVWKELNGDNTFALDWPLTEYSHVWEIGGFYGRWAKQIWDKYHCNITIFEPQDWAVERMENEFRGNAKIEIRPYGLWTEDTTFDMGGWETDGASIYSTREPIRPAHFRNILREIADFKKPIDVALMNIEGAEYTLIPELINSGGITRIEHFWCQFHPGEGNEPHIRSLNIFNDMTRTHELMWNFYPTATAWRKNPC